MIHAVLLCCALIGDGGNPAVTTSADRAAYEAAAGKAGKNAAAHVQLALWCEAHGMTAERIKHLNLAVSLAPANLLARGILGQVAFQGKWAKPEEVERENQRDPKLQALFREYLDRRIHTRQKSADAQLRLAAWCFEHGLRDEAMAHYNLVTVLEPSREIAWTRLGYKKYKDRWFKPAELAAQKLESDRQKLADAQWKPKLQKLREALEGTSEARRLKAERELYQTRDPRAAAMIWKIFGCGTEQMQLTAVELLAQIEGPAASFFIAALAIEKPSTEVRQRAAAALARRDPRDVIGWLINLLHKPYTYEVRRGTGPGSTATLFVDGEEFDLRRFYRLPDVDPRLVPASFVRSAGLPGVENETPKWTRLFAAHAVANAAAAIDEIGRRHGEAMRAINDDVRAIEEANARINDTNGVCQELLETLTGQKLGNDPTLWQKWWAEELGFTINDHYSQDKPTITEEVGEPNLPVAVPVFSVIRVSCFAAGTSVQTMSGPRKIELLAVGDRVLSQDTSTGALSFQPVLATTVRPGATTLRLKIDSDTIVATGIHRFWKAGKGWTMARDLKPGDRLRRVDGVATVQSIDPDAVQSVYNLSVAENRSFLIGKAGVLVHDVTFVVPVPEPFDRQANLPAAAVK
jgi:Pretoxin HINT domain